MWWIIYVRRYAFLSWSRHSSLFVEYGESNAGETCQYRKCQWIWYQNNLRMRSEVVMSLLERSTERTRQAWECTVAKIPEMAENSWNFRKLPQNCTKIKEFVEFLERNFLKSGISWRTLMPVLETGLPTGVKPAYHRCLVCEQELIFHELLVKNTTLKIQLILNITSAEEL